MEKISGTLGDIEKRTERKEEKWSSLSEKGQIHGGIKNTNTVTYLH